MDRRVCYCWELGGGFGHLNRFEPIARVLEEMGWTISVIVKDLATSHKVFRGMGIDAIQAPSRSPQKSPQIPEPITYGDLLLNLGFRDASELDSRILSWRNLFEEIRPDLLIFDHAPTAALAGRGIDSAQVSLGTGFCCPPPLEPLPPMAPWKRISSQELAKSEGQLVHRINLALARQHIQPLNRLADIYQCLDANFLATFKELDHYPGRPNGDYVGTWTSSTQTESKITFPGWGEQPGRRIFAYLKNFPAVFDLASWLDSSPYVTVLVVEGLPRNHKLRNLKNITIYDRLVRLEAIREECDLAILNGNHGVTSEFLLAGVPTLQIPLVLEQAITTDCVHRTGAGLPGNAADVRQLVAQINQLMSDSKWSAEAQRFRETYQDFSSTSAVDEVVHRLIQLVS